VTDRPDDPHIDAIRRRYHAVVERHAPHASALKWRKSRFERGLRLADEIESRVGSLQGLRVLDVGAAHGGDLSAMFARGAHCVGADMFDHHYDELVGGVGQGSPYFSMTRFDCLGNWPLRSDSFDVIISLGVLEIVDDLNLFFSEMARVLKPSGLAVAYTGTALRMIRRDALYKLPLISVLPTRLRRLVAEKLFHRVYRFPVANHTFYSASTLRRHAKTVGLDVCPQKYARSDLMQRLVRHFAFDFVVVTPQPKQPSVRKTQAGTAEHVSS